MKKKLVLILSIICLKTLAIDRARFNELYLLEIDNLDPSFCLSINTLENSKDWVEPTPSQPKGPFYPIRIPNEKDYDLTIKDNGAKAQGVEVYIQGQVMDEEGIVLPNVKIEIWQACVWGKYDHPQDPNDAPIDPNFQYYGSVNTDETGKYIFKTIVPGPYPASENWWRPPHIHFLISKEGFRTLITQSYFDGNSFSEPITTVNGKPITGDIINDYNEKDLLLNRLKEKERSRLIISFRDSLLFNETIKLGVFNIYLRKK